jgi:hypothetical protein
MALHDRASRDVQVVENLVGAPPADELDGGVVHLPKKECQGTAGPKGPGRDVTGLKAKGVANNGGGST